jgi:Bacterial Ig-like domain (group 2).
MKQKNRIFYFIILFIIFSLLASIYASAISTSAASPSFTKKYKTITVGTTIQYKVKHLKKTYSVNYNISNPALATIHPKTGKLYPKKAGKITVTATISNKKRQKICQLNNTLLIKAKKMTLPNASLQIKETINPYNFTLTLSCSRILLEHEIKDSLLTMFPKGKTAPKLKANFLELSNNGKEITYLFNAESQKKLCPGDFSMDGRYIVQSSHYHKKLSLTYQERLTKNTLAGFVLKQDGNPVKNAMLSLKTDSGTKKCNTDEHGRYLIKNITSSPISLTASKDGFQTVTIQEPPLSQKGVSCENFILRPLDNECISIEFLVTDTNNHPIPNSEITITSLTNKSDNHTEKHFSFSDNLSEKNILFTNQTNADGKLFLTNKVDSNNFPAPCSAFQVNKETKLTYLPTYQPAENDTIPFTDKTFNTKSQYLIYVNKTSSEKSPTSYYAQKIYFSFSHLASNHAFFHVQLLKCPKLSIESMSFPIEETMPPLSCKTALLRLFHKEKKEPAYEHSINLSSFQITEKELSLSSFQLPISLFDGIYYIQLQLFSKEGEILMETPISQVMIQSSTLVSPKIALRKPRYARIIAYSNAANHIPETASFSLYQKSGQSYFLIDTFTTDFFTANNNAIYTAKLILSHLLSNENYLLIPKEDTITANETLPFTATPDNTYLTKKEAYHSILPLAKVHCDNKSDFVTTDKPFITITYSDFHKITADFIRTSPSYPNCVLAFYQTDGILLTTALTNKTEKTIVPALVSEKSSSILDIYTNRETLVTNQKSYHMME